MRPILLVFCGLFSANLYAQDISLTELRTSLFIASSDKKVCYKLHDILAKSQLENYPVHAAYLATFVAMKAKFTVNPYSKLKYFNKGTKALDGLLKKHSDAVELVFLRFSIQSKAPSFLGYSADVVKDKTFLIQNLQQLEATDLRNLIGDFLLQSSHCSPSEQDRISKMLINQ